MKGITGVILAVLATSACASVETVGKYEESFFAREPIEEVVVAVRPRAPLELETENDRIVVRSHGLVTRCKTVGWETETITTYEKRVSPNNTWYGMISGGIFAAGLASVAAGIAINSGEDGVDDIGPVFYGVGTVVALLVSPAAIWAAVQGLRSIDPVIGERQVRRSKKEFEPEHECADTTSPVDGYVRFSLGALDQKVDLPRPSSKEDKLAELWPCDEVAQNRVAATESIKVKFRVRDQTSNTELIPARSYIEGCYRKSRDTAARVFEGDELARTASAIAALRPTETAVFAFNERGVGPTLLGEYLADKVIALLRRSDVRLVERSRLETVLLEQKLAVQGYLDDNTAASVGHMAGARSVLVGVLTQVHDRWELSLRLLEAESARVKMATELGLPTSAIPAHLVGKPVRAGAPSVR